MAALLKEAVQSAVREGLFPAGDVPPVKIEYPREESFGDYSTPFCLEAARILKKSPMEIGETIKSHIGGRDVIGDINIARPGFINMFVSLEYLYKNLKQVLSQRDGYGKNVKDKPARINIEFVSANPTGPLNIVSARAAAIGDTLANLIEAAGDMVDREFYVNDYGNQVRLLGLSVLCRYRELKGESVSFPENGYHGGYVADIAKHIMENHGGEADAIADEDALIEFMASKAIEYNVKGQREDLEGFNVRFKKWFSERTLHEDGSVERTLADLEGRGVIYEEEGRKVFRSTDYGDDKDRVVVREDGRPTYLLADIAYHRDKMARGYDMLIDIWGPDHHGYIARLKGAMQALGFPEGAFKVLISQQVNLIMEGEMVKMSKRLGNFSTMSDLLEEVGVDVSRYFFLMRSIDSHLDFDLVLASKASSENPVFYLQYAHARICSIFREAEKRGIPYDSDNSAIDYLDHPETNALLKLLARFPEEISDAGGACEPHRMTNYLLRLAQAYHRFYTEHRVLSDDETRTNTYLSLCDATRIVLKNGLALLGVSAPERM
ncbi:MAG TPA: arginine--tRNA ligase [Spirochaetes bacterium]|nr:arginine--tRNA ligase [Spirochaetota bacterium]